MPDYEHARKTIPSLKNIGSDVMFWVNPNSRANVLTKIGLARKIGLRLKIKNIGRTLDQ